MGASQSGKLRDPIGLEARCGRGHRLRENLAQRYLDLPRHGCHVHASLLPALRGAAPIQWSVIRGRTEAGVTIVRMDAGMDTGDIGLQVAVILDRWRPQVNYMTDWPRLVPKRSLMH